MSSPIWKQRRALLGFRSLSISDELHDRRVLRREARQRNAARAKERLTDVTECWLGHKQNPDEAWDGTTRSCRNKVRGYPFSEERWHWHEKALRRMPKALRGKQARLNRKEQP